VVAACPGETPSLAGRRERIRAPRKSLLLQVLLAGAASVKRKSPMSLLRLPLMEPDPSWVVRGLLWEAAEELPEKPLRRGTACVEGAENLLNRSSGSCPALAWFGEDGFWMFQITRRNRAGRELGDRSSQKWGEGWWFAVRLCLLVCHFPESNQECGCSFLPCGTLDSLIQTLAHCSRTSTRKMSQTTINHMFMVPRKQG